MPSSTKNVSLIVGGAGNQIQDVAVARGTTTRDLLEQLNLGGSLSKIDDPTPLKPNKDLYAQVEDGEKLRVSPSSPVARGEPDG